MKHNRTIIIFCALACMFTLLSTITVAQQCPFDLIYSNPWKTIGTKIECQSQIEAIISVSFPLGLIMKSNNYIWYCIIFEHSLPAGSIIKGNTIFVKGQYIGTKELLYRGNVIKIPEVYATEVSVAK